MYSFYWVFSESIRGKNYHLNKLVPAETYFWVYVSAEIGHFFYVRWTKNLNLVEPLFMVTRTWSDYFVISKFLDYMQNYMLRLERKDWTWNNFMFTRSHDWTTPLPLRKTLLTFHFQLCQLLEQYFLHCTRYVIKGLKILLRDCSRIVISPSEKYKRTKQAVWCTRN